MQQKAGYLESIGASDLGSLRKDSTASFFKAEPGDLIAIPPGFLVLSVCADEKKDFMYIRWGAWPKGLDVKKLETVIERTSYGVSSMIESYGDALEESYTKFSEYLSKLD
jgi:hypothetical protein